MRTLPYGFPLLDLVRELAFSAAQTKAHPLTTPLHKDFDSLLSETRLTLDMELELVTAQAVAAAKVLRSDEVLNLLTDQISRALLDVGGTRRSPLYQRFFGSERPCDVKRPLLGAQLELMRDWLPTLHASTVPALKNLAKPLEGAIKEADMAVEEQRRTDRELADFREIGTCKALLDKVNAARKAAYGKLAELVHARPEANLPQSFAEQFFLRESRWTPPTRDELERAVARSEQQLARLRQQLKELEDRDAQELARQKESEAATLRESLAAAEKRAAEEQAAIATMRTRLERLTPPPNPPV